MATVELQQLRRLFGDVAALDGIDVSIASGEFVSLLGPSGCGKTTALRLIAGFDRPTSGRVLIDGKDVTGVPPNRRDMGMVFQAYCLFPNMTAERNVEFGLRMRKQPARRRRRAGRGAARPRRARPRREALSAPALGRHAAARRARARARDRAARAAPRRAALGARREGARPAAGGDPPHPDPARDHDDLRDARPGGGALDLRPRRRPLAGQDRADRPAGRDLRRAGDAVRGRVRRHDEPHRVGRLRPERGGSSRAVPARRRRRPWTPAGERVLLLVRPETVELSADSGGGGTRRARCSHRRSSVPRRACTSRPRAASGPPTSPPSAPAASRSAPGSSVSFPAASARLLTLGETEEALPAQIRTISDDPVHAERGELPHALRVVDRVDARSPGPGRPPSRSSAA